MDDLDLQVTLLEVVNCNQLDWDLIARYCKGRLAQGEGRGSPICLNDYMAEST